MEYYAYNLFGAVSIGNLDEEQLKMFLLQLGSGKKIMPWGDVGLFVVLQKSWTQPQAEKVRWMSQFKKGIVHINIIPASLLEDVEEEHEEAYRLFTKKMETVA